jgi:RNA polymerase sigma-70 factor (ECF subfamily)
VSIDDDDDAAVIERSRSEPAHFGAIFDRHAAEIHRYVTRRLGDGLADDIVSETFLVAFRKRARYSTDRRSARPWLYGIAGNLIGRHRRTEVRAYRALARTGEDPVAESYADRVEAKVTAESTREELAGALAGLSAGDREVLLLIAWGDLSYEEVAQAMSIPVGTVRSRLNRARRKSRETFGGVNPTRIAEVANHG